MANNTLYIGVDIGGTRIKYGLVDIATGKVVESIGGGIAKGLQPYIGKIKGRSYMGPYPGYDFKLVVSELQEMAGMLGSAALFQTQNKYQPHEF